CDRPGRVPRYLPAHGKDRGQGAGRASVLPLGRAGASDGGAALEFPQISDRPRRAAKSGLHLRRGADRPESRRRNRDGTRKRIISRPKNVAAGTRAAAIVVKANRLLLTNHHAGGELSGDIAHVGWRSLGVPARIRGSSRVAFRLGRPQGRPFSIWTFDQAAPKRLRADI